VPEILLARQVSKARIEHIENLFVDLSVPDDFYTIDSRAKWLYLIWNNEEIKFEFFPTKILKYVTELFIWYKSNDHIDSEIIQTMLKKFYPLKSFNLETSSLSTFERIDLIAKLNPICYKERVQFNISVGANEGQVVIKCWKAATIKVNSNTGSYEICAK